MARLRAVARFWDIDLPAGRRREVAARLAGEMSAPQVIAEAVEALPDDQRRVLDALLVAGGRMPRRIFTRRWGEIRPMGPGRMEREQPWREPVSAAEGLWYRGFIFPAFEQGPEGAYQVVFVPPELRERLPLPKITPPVITLEPAPAPSAARVGGDALLDDGCTLLAYLQNEQLRPASDGSWPARGLSNLARRLRDPDPERLAFLVHLARRLAWSRTTDSGWLRPDPETATDWLRSPPGQQRLALAQGWRDDPQWNDLFHVPTLRPEDTGAWRNDPLLARAAILRHLEVCAPGAWYEIRGLSAAIRQADPDFQRPDGDYNSWYIRDAASDAYLSGFESWDAVEGALIHYLITGPLAWLGLTDLDGGSPPAFFRLSPAGAAFLGLTPLPSETEPAQLTLRPDFTVRVPPARRYERFQLARVADWVSSPLAREAERGLFLYRLTPNSLERGRRQGIPVARVLEFLARVTAAPVPRSVAAALTRWEARGAEARLERVVLLRFSDEKLMDEVVSAPAARRLVRERVGPAAALVREQDWPRLAAALGEMGLLPEIVALEEKSAD